MRVVTHVTDGSELFVEFPSLVAGHHARFIVHFKRTSDYRAVTEGQVSVLLGQADTYAASATVEAPARPGVFLPTLTAPVPGTYDLILTLQTADDGIAHELGPVEVHASHEVAKAAAGGVADADEGIRFLKEQQWQTDFRVDPVGSRQLQASVRAPATLRADSAREAQVVAPVDGWITAAGDLQAPGLQVRQGDTLLRIVPRLGEATDHATLEAEAARARAAFRFAQNELARIRGLFEQGVIAERRLQAARADYESARAAHDAASRRLEQYGKVSGEQTGGVVVPSPINGEVARVYVGAGSYVSAGTPLMYVVDRRELWLEAQVSEADTLTLDAPTGAWFEAGAGPVAVTPETGARLVSYGARIDPRTRTAPVIFAFPSPDPRLRIGQYVEARIYTGEEREALAIPRSAVIDDTGSDVVFVQRDGEHFERRLVTLGIRDGDWVEVIDGLTSGERIVTRGAYLVHLAASVPAEVGHGHAH
ncbi:MAG TPA: efflux RND transporter periplasmic adaptor subunit [Thioalkalivibrio sp.]|nr:efflux RND transporter periplasmic adaptor subunit [Thioalkalivibrio sp.]